MKPILLRSQRVLFDNQKELVDYATEWVSPFYVNQMFGEVTQNIVGHRRKVLNFLLENLIIKRDYNGLGWRFTAETEEELLVKLENIKKIETQKRAKKEGKRFICADCEYKWESRKNFGEPAICPQCNSKNITSFENLKKIVSKN